MLTLLASYFFSRSALWAYKYAKALDDGLFRYFKANSQFFASSKDDSGRPSKYILATAPILLDS
ncbi:hypothetical protein D3C72_2254500 [compost metagenome]